GSVRLIAAQIGGREGWPVFWPPLSFLEQRLQCSREAEPADELAPGSAFVVQAPRDRLRIRVDPEHQHPYLGGRHRRNLLPPERARMSERPPTSTPRPPGSRYLRSAGRL